MEFNSEKFNFLVALHGRQQTYILDEANGITSDYTYSVGIKYSYTPELRGDSFDPPPEEIQPSFDEVWAGLVAMYNEIEIIEGI